jgi:arginine decarboxylase
LGNREHVETLGVELAEEAGWMPRDAEELYHMNFWSDDFFHVNDLGNVGVRPVQGSRQSVDLRRVVKELERRGTRFPVVIRFQDILHARVVRINEAFIEACKELGYKNRYISIYPIKVNQLHEVVEEILDAGKPYGLGLECGSKAELVAALAHLEDDRTLLICNGYKDEMMLRMILSAQRLGKLVIPVIEKYSEFTRLLKLAQEMGVRPRMGVRVRLSTPGVGKWAESGGERSKFGITIPELVRAVDELKRLGFTDSLELLHFHLGSQLTDIQTLKKAIKEFAQIYVQLWQREIGVKYLDIGGGLGVNYGLGYGSTKDSINYTLIEYARSAVYAVQEVCDTTSTPHPIILSESGRALSAHHSVLVVDILGIHRKEGIESGFTPAKTDHPIIHEMDEIWRIAQTDKTQRLPVLLEAYHDAVEKRLQSESLFTFGYLPLEQKAIAEKLYWSICYTINEKVKQSNAEWLPDELTHLDDVLIDQYQCDFSVFQSMLDYWAIGQCFPVMPIQRLDERPDRRAILVDLTCDSDGKVCTFISPYNDKDYLEVHDLREHEPYYLGFFMMGAYQDIMGDMHNLFGRVSEVHVYASEEEPEGFYIEKSISGASVEEMLAQVQYFPNDLLRRMNKLVREKVQAGVIQPSAGYAMIEEYEHMMKETTYFRNS